MKGQMELLDYLATLEKKGINIIDYIPVGHNHAISRYELSKVSGICDRAIRHLIHNARRENVILNMQDGSGYFQPDMNDPEDRMQLKRYIKQEESRLKSTGWALKAARKALRDHDV